MEQDRPIQEIINQWTSMDEPADVALLSAPVTYPPIPSIALSIFQATLDDAGITSKVIYPMFLAMRLLGNESIHELSGSVNLFNNGEFLFAHLTDVPTPCTTEEFVSVVCRQLPDSSRKHVCELVESAKEAAGQIVDAAAEKIVNMGARILAASSIYSQHNASLAIMRKVKELDPSVTTVIGGYNVSGEAGLAVLRNFPSVDYVSFGEGDETIAEVCRIILGQSSEQMPYGIVGRNDPVPDPVPYRMTQDMDTVRTPEYRDYFEEKERAMDGFYGDIFSKSGINLDQVIFLEGSRGCWWGQRKACAFCGLNGLTDVYREKSVEHFHDELRKAMQRYPGATIQLSDNVLSRQMIHEVFPLLADDPEKYHILGEIKTNLSFDEIRILVRAGFYCVQPGIESLNDHLLDLMGKGSSAVQNIALLKYARSFGLYPVWNMLCGVPGEEKEDYEQIIGLIPLVHHLCPPSLPSRIQFNRFSRYGAAPADFGLELEPDDVYQLSYHGNEDLIQNMGSVLKLTGGPFYDTVRQNLDLYDRLAAAILEWHKAFSPENRAQLVMRESTLGLMIFDSRPVAPAERVILLGLRARLYRLAKEPVSLKRIQAALPDDSAGDIQTCLDELVSRKLMIFLSGRYLALASTPE